MKKNSRRTLLYHSSQLECMEWALAIRKKNKKKKEEKFLRCGNVAALRTKAIFDALKTSEKLSEGVSFRCFSSSG